ncbi:MAG TPA: NUDIX hydrolase [Alphaproteobacteria bacterium]|jgi:8-oxo-dGTP pyrophosphatase MutT (NUDIX family)|nr:NUDIX hydrolase [Alphaproteobacteria bacterium]
MSKKPRQPAELLRQYGVIPVRKRKHGKQVLLLTSRETGRWIVPKGWPMRHRSPAEAAAREAYEEAGLKGTVMEPAIGRYIYRKIGKHGAARRISVEVFLMRVSRQLRDWPEKHERNFQWLAPAKAASFVKERRLATLIGKAGRIRWVTVRKRKGRKTRKK